MDVLSNSQVGLQLSALLEDNTSRLAGAAASLGLLFHISILRTLEVESFLYTLLGFGLVTVAALFAAQIHVGFDPITAGVRVGIISASFNVSLFFSITVYRIFFHRLRRFPGPFLAKVTRFYSAYQASRHLRYFEVVTAWKEQYGDFIRTGPREIAIFRDSAIPLIFGPDSKCRKSTWYNQVEVDPKKASIHMTRDYDQHKKRRRAWDRGFSVKALNSYEPIINGKVDEFIAQLTQRTTVDATAWSMYLSFDIMGKVGFGKDFCSVTKGEEHSAIEALHGSMTVLGIFSHVPWVLNILGKIPSGTYKEFFTWCSSEIEAQRKTWTPVTTPKNIVGWLLKAVMDQDISASPSEQALHDDSRVVIVAGSETTATTLACIFYFLAKYPAVQQKLQSQLDEAYGPDGRWDYERVKTVTFLDDIIHETLRLKPALLTGGFRVTPPEGITVDGTFIPGDTNVFVPIQPIHRDPRYWPQADTFIPERFGERRKEMGTDNAPYMPFNMGAYLCPGKGLAFLSLRTSLSKILREFNVGFGLGEDGKEFDKDGKDTFTKTLPPLLIHFEKRK